MSKFLSKSQVLLARLSANESGASAAEYGLLIALIAVVIIGSVTALGTNLAATFTAVTAAL